MKKLKEIGERLQSPVPGIIRKAQWFFGTAGAISASVTKIMEQYPDLPLPEWVPKPEFIAGWTAISMLILQALTHKDFQK